MTTKTKAIKEWWHERVTVTRSQIHNGRTERCDLCRPMHCGVPWKRRVETSMLYYDFLLWAAGDGRLSALNLSKGGFMLLFYPISGATMSQMRHKGKRVKVAKFGLLAHHKRMLGGENETSSCKSH